MIKEQLRSLKVSNKVHSGESSIIFQLDDGRLAKIINPVFLNIYRMMGINYEGKIQDTRAKCVSEIVSPITGIYDENICCGYTMSEVKGISLNEREKSLSLDELGNLKGYARLYAKIEEAVKKANKLGIVIPDLCTPTNIIITDDGSVKLIDYDDMQLGSQDASLALSTMLGTHEDYINSKKFAVKPFHYTSELDKLSLTLLMFKWTFHINLKKVNTYNPYDGKLVEIKDVFDAIGLEDEQFINKVSANIGDTQRGSYLTEDMMRIADNYDMIVYDIPGAKTQGKKLVKKQNK